MYYIYIKLGENIMENKTYYIVTYGCQMNVHESEKLAGIMRELGYQAAKSEEAADAVIFNTCCIRENAEDRAMGNIGALKKLKQKKKELIVAVGGCMTQQRGAAEKLHNTFPFVDIVFGTHNLENFKELFLKKLNQKKSVIEVADAEKSIAEGTPKFRSSYPNAWVNIMYGCNNFCTYCIVPYVRGRERSRKPEDILSECKDLISQGYKEITLLGQNVNSYGNDVASGVSFADLLRKIAALEGKFRLRFMTNHPKDLSEDIALAIRDNAKICRAVHLPVQSGSNRILQAMNRRYTREDYLRKLKILREIVPECAVTSDIMVGFPTETEEDFRDTLDLVEQAKFYGAFTFVYSPRSGTQAAAMDGQIPEEVSKDRIMRLIELQNAVNREISETYIGRCAEVLCEGFDEAKERCFGRDEFGKMIYFNGKKEQIGSFLNVKITNASGIALTGKLTEDKE